jgi:hypothetical protein
MTVSDEWDAIQPETSANVERRLTRLESVYAIRQLCNEYSQDIDRREFPLLAQLFARECEFTLQIKVDGITNEPATERVSLRPTSKTS